ncbi:MAG: hypothetical protein ABIR51_08165 [Sphingomicrobium sp.]
MLQDLVQIFAIFCVLFLPVMLIFGRPFIRQWFELKHKRLEVESRLAAEKAAQYATANTQLEARVRVLEQIVTDRGVETASQIEALRAPRLTGGDPLK